MDVVLDSDTQRVAQQALEADLNVVFAFLMGSSVRCAPARLLNLRSALSTIPSCEPASAGIG